MYIPCRKQELLHTQNHFFRLWAREQDTFGLWQFPRMIYMNICANMIKSPRTYLEFSHSSVRQKWFIHKIWPTNLLPQYHFCKEPIRTLNVVGTSIWIYKMINLNFIFPPTHPAIHSSLTHGKAPWLAYISVKNDKTVPALRLTIVKVTTTTTTYAQEVGWGEKNENAFTSS